MEPKRSWKCRTSENSKFDNSYEISQLPEAILQHILFFLPIQEAVRVSTLSKNWLHVWNSLPVFCFTFDQHQLGLSMLDFMNQVNTSLSVLQNQKAKIECFTLKTSLSQEDFASHIDNWVGLVMRNYVKELCINVSGLRYTLPQATFDLKSLVKLRLEGCNFPSTLYLADTTQEFNCLKELHLKKIHANGDLVQNLVKCFRLLERLTIFLGTPMKCLVLDNFPKLNFVAVAVKILKVDVASLQTLVLRGGLNELHASNSTVNLKQLVCSLSSSCTLGDGNRLLELVSKSPLLETLFLKLGNNERIRIQHYHLKALYLYWRFNDPMVVEIDAPNLREIHCNGSVFSSLCVTSTSIKEHETFSLNIRGVAFAILDGSCIHQLGNCLRNFNPNITVNLENLCTENLLTLEQLQEQAASHPSNVSKLVLSSVSASSDYTSFVDGLLWTCHPSTLLIKRCSANGDNFIKFLCRELLGRPENPTCCGDDHQSKCWKHFVKGVEVQYYMRGCEPEEPILLHSNNLSETLVFCDTEKEVKFIFEWFGHPV